MELFSLMFFIPFLQDIYTISYGNLKTVLNHICFFMKIQQLESYNLAKNLCNFFPFTRVIKNVFSPFSFTEDFSWGAA